MEDIWVLVGGLGVGFLAAGFVGIFGRRRMRRLAAAGDEDAKRNLEKWRTLHTVVAPVFLAIGICMLAVKFYADYQKALTPLSREKALERATKNLMNRPPISN
jgi:hypothetical protein